MEKSSAPPEMTVYGFAKEATDFNNRHPGWYERMNRLADTINFAFVRTHPTCTTVEKVVYFYGNLIAEEFMEIFLVAVNGYGGAATKLLRSMYEHTVTLRYLQDHPGEVQQFMDYDHVQQYKLMKPIIDTFGEGALRPDIVADVNHKFEEVKHRFMIADCKKCGTQKINHTWNKLDFVSMAKKTGAIGQLIVPNYFLPLRQAHATFRAIYDRLELVNGSIRFGQDSQTELADEALLAAHNCVLLALEIQNERFKIVGLTEKLQICLHDWVDTWTPGSLDKE